MNVDQPADRSIELITSAASAPDISIVPTGLGYYPGSHTQRWIAGL